VLIKKKMIIRTIVLTFAIISFSGCVGNGTGNRDMFNVVFFLVDDMGWRDVGCYGSSFYETPHIDRFAKEGVRFTNAYAACHVCSPSRASIMTGKYPATLHLTDWLPGRRDFPFQKLLNAEINQHLPFEEITIAEALREQGYSTAIIGKWHLGMDPSGPMEHGFDKHIPEGWNPCCPPRSGYHAPWDLKGLGNVVGDYLTDRLTDEALVYIEQNRDNPFFLYLSHFAVHDPIEGRPDLVKSMRRS
jgi:arylsulfatase A-like enzyme